MKDSQLWKMKKGLNSKENCLFAHQSVFFNNYLFDNIYLPIPSKYSFLANKVASSST